MSQREGRLPDQDKGRRRRSRTKSAQRPFEKLKSLLLQNTRRPLNLTEDHLISLLSLRRARAAVFGNDLFSDPAWDILLELYAAHLGARDMSLSELAQAIETPHSTTARWITALDERGLLKSTIDPKNPAGVRIQLTAQGASKMKNLANHWGSAFVSIG